MSGLNGVQGDRPIFEVEIVGNVRILRVVPDPTVSNYRSRQYEYNRIYKQLDDDPGKHMLVDLTGCVMLDSVTIGILVSLTGRTRQHEGEAILVGVSPDIQEMLARLMLLQPDNKRAMWQTYATRDDGIALLNASRS